MTRALTTVAPSPLATLKADVEGAVRSAGQSRAPATLKAYLWASMSFQRWCRQVGKLALPAEPATVAVYLQHVADRRNYKPATLDLHLAAIAWEHRRHGMSFDRRAVPVADVRAGLRRQKGVKQKQARPLLVEDLAVIVKPLGASARWIDVRDRALLLLSFAGAFRSSELLGAMTGLRVSDCKRTRNGYELTVRRSKTDQEGAGMVKHIAEGRPGTCPVAALDAWLAWPWHTTDGPLFVGMKFGRVGSTQEGKAPAVGLSLTRLDLSRILKRRADRAGLDVTGFSGHSPRAGLVTEAVEAGVAVRDIQVVTGHKDINVLEGYVRRNQAKVRPAAKGLL